ncbi:MAG: hypothetical protein H7841_14270 [Magnetospirillum sp. WYHS-4]
MNVHRRHLGRDYSSLDRALAEERALVGVTVSPMRAAEVQARKWTAIRSYFAEHPFVVSDRLSRAEQWRRAAGHIKDVLDEPELVEWTATQAEIARHRAEGIQDLRPHGDGPCHADLMRWLRGKEYKALAVLGWLEAAEATGTGAGFR